MLFKKEGNHIVPLSWNGTRRLLFDSCHWLLLLAVVLVPACARLAAQSEGAQERPADLSHGSASKLLLTQVKPEYPSIARVNYIWGQVRLLVRVGRTGRVSFAHVVQGHPFLAASALEAVRQWVYRPYVTPGGPREFETEVAVNFSLRPPKLGRLPLDAEQDLTRQVRPPQPPLTPAAGAPTDYVRMRVLVDGRGQAIDATPLEGQPSLFPAARRIIDGWKFRPARWGNLLVPWYVDVRVLMGGVQPGEEKSESLAAAPTGR